MRHLLELIGTAFLSCLAAAGLLYAVELANSRSTELIGSVVQVQKFPDLEMTPATYFAYIRYDDNTHEVRRLDRLEFRDWGRPLMRVVLKRRVGTFGSEISREYELRPSD